jgi:hypothetical protein
MNRKIGQVPSLADVKLIQSTNALEITSAFAIVASIFSKRFRKSEFLESFGELALETQIARAFPALLVDLGWPPLWDIGLSDAVRLVRLNATRGAASVQPDIESLALATYDDALIKTKVVAWRKKEFVQARLPILEAGVAAHLRGDYACSIPTLLPQIEGIATDYFGRVRPLDVKKPSTQARMLLGHRGRKNTLLGAMDEAMLRFYLDVVLASVGRRDELPLTLNRHVILHGRDPDYARKTTSLQTLLTIDYLLNSFAIITVRGGAVYHVSTCPVLDRVKGEVECRSDLSPRALAGLRPCSVCSPPRLR